MNKKIIIFSVTLLAITAVGHYLLQQNHSMSTSHGAHEMSDGQMMDHSAMMVSSEREFVAGMIPHHQEAVDTANEVLARGGSTEAVRTLAQEIIAAQEKEIADLMTWHEDWYGETYKSDNSYQPMMRDLSALSGADLDRQFLTDMIPHHEGAIMMADSVRPYIEHEEITTMADAIVSTQAAEIALMQQLLTEL